MIPFDFEEIRQAILESPVDSSVYIGADSKVFSSHGNPMVAYVTVVILHYGSSKGAKIFKSHRTDRYYGQIRQRLMTEVTDAICAGTEIMDVIGDRGFEIHLDINRDERYKSSEIIKEATGYVMGTLGFEPKLKPESFAASSVADRFCVKDARRKADTPAMKRKYKSKAH
jgi:predicted RNase H-related nuclease YkuK (DUF458 family)